ncbi:MAG TPA: hypothetical protein VI874_02885 [Candidatus Norongarragalinales archaeon]|nr:hypothetical protein [Candidatus Norongarragalinales archaeon]
MLIELNLWIFLLLLGAGILGTLLAAMRPTENHLKKALFFGLLLAVCDFLFENVGALKGLWFTSGSAWFMFGLFVPVEVFLIAAMAGIAFYLVFPPHKNALYILSSALLIAAAGIGIEAILIDHALLTYANGWTSYQALASYFSMFVLLHLVSLKVHGMRILHQDERVEYEHPRTGKVLVLTKGSSFAKKKR